MRTSTIRAIVLTLAVTFLTLKFFLGTILGAFGLATVTFDQVHKFRASQQVVEKMKRKNATRKTKVSDRFARRATRRVGGSAAAAVIPVAGILTVALYVATEEAIAYCDEQADIQDTENILNGTAVEFSMDDCKAQAMVDAERIAIEQGNAAQKKLEASSDGLWEKLQGQIEQHLPGVFK